jgi:hypothetical protein
MIFGGSAVQREETSHLRRIWGRIVEVENYAST